MKFALVFVAVLAVSAAQPPVSFSNLNRLPTTTRPPPPKPVAGNRVASSDQAANVLRYDNEASPDGSYRYNVQIDNGITAEAQGTPRDFGGNPPVAPVVSQGSFSWISPEGQLIVITYIADENGYQPSGAIVPPRLFYSNGSLILSADIGASISNPLQISLNRRAYLPPV